MDREVGSALVDREYTLLELLARMDPACLDLPGVVMACDMSATPPRIAMAASARTDDAARVIGLWLWGLATQMAPLVGWRAMVRIIDEGIEYAHAALVESADPATRRELAAAFAAVDAEWIERVVRWIVERGEGGTQ